MHQQIIHIERTYPISIMDLWRALTSKENMKEWFFEISNFTMNEGDEFEFFRFNKDQDSIHKCKVLKVEPGSVFKFSWKHPRQHGEPSIVTWTLIPRGGVTTLHLTHEGIENFKGTNGKYDQSDLEDGWSYLLGESLNKYLDKFSSSAV